jgi:hypothetical protein
MKAKSEWVAFNERVIGSGEDSSTGRKIAVRVREVIYVVGDGKGSVLFLRGETEPLGVCEDIATVMGRLEQ